MLVPILLVIVSGFCSCHDLFVEMQHMTWKKANSTCKLATPGIIFNNTLPTIQLRLAKNDIWVGYVQMDVALLYVGCSVSSEVSFDKHFANVGLDPGVCFSLCKTAKYFGIGPINSTCYCINTLPSNINSLCATRCAGRIDRLCGGTDSTNSSHNISIYEKIQNQSSIDNNPDKHCRAFDPCKRDYLWDKCNTRFKFSCYENSTIKYYNGSESWSYHMKQCLEMKQAPVLNQEKHQECRKYWTGVIKVKAIFSAHEINESAAIFTVGYVHQKDRETMDLLFDDRESANKQKSLCNEESAKSTTKQTIDIVTSPDRRTNNVTDHGDTSGTTTQLTYTWPDRKKIENVTKQATDVSTSSNRRNHKVTDHNSEIIEAVYVTIAVVAIAIIMIIVGIIIYIRRKRLKGQTSNSHSLDIGSNDKQNDNGANDTAGAHNKESAHELSHYSECSYAQNNQQKRELDCDSNYDTTNIKQKNSSNTDNIYNKLDYSPYDTFNHVTPVSDDTYSHMTPIHTGSDNTYNHIGLIKTNTGNYDTYNHIDLIKRNTGNDDTYNHIDLIKRNTGSDNTYNHIDLIKRNTGNDDTYNHIDLIKRNTGNDDTYNHVPYTSPENDDTYNHVMHSSAIRDIHSRQMYTENNDVYNHAVRKTPEGDDTYSHIMK